MNVARLSDENLANLGQYERLVADGRTWTNQELHEASCRLASGLRGLGLHADDRVALLLPNCAEVLISIPAVWRIGATLVPLLSDLRPSELANCLRHSAAKAIITTAQLLGSDGVADALSCVERQVVVWDADDGPGTSFSRLVQEGEPLAEAAPRAADDLAVILYTGGTTGRPKGVKVTHNNLRANAINNSTLDTPMVELAVLPLAHSYGLGVCIGNYLGGGKTVLMRRFEPAEALALIEKHRIEKMLAVPTMLISLMHHPRAGQFDTSSMRLWGTGGAPMSAAEIEKFLATFGGELGVAYGMTEAGPTVARTGSGPYPEGSCGKPIQGVEVRIVDDSDEPLPTGTIGEICVRSEAVSPGYLDDPAETERTFRDGWLHTGDLGRLDDDGFLYVVGRTKDVILQGGFNVHPADVEAVISRHGAVRECAVVGIPDDLLGEAVAAYVAPVAGEQLDDAALRAHCTSQLAAYKVPVHYVFVDELPRTDLGKVDRRALRARPLETSQHGTAALTHASLAEVTDAVSAMFARLVGVEALDSSDDFFELGGVSTNATRLIAWVKERFAVNLKLRAFFENPTVEAISQTIYELQQARSASAPTTRASSPVTPAQLERLTERFGSLTKVYPLTPAQQDDMYKLVDDERRVTPEALVEHGMIMDLTIRGELDPEILRRACQLWFARYDNLHGVFVWEDLPQPVLVVPESVELPFVVKDLRDADAATQVTEQGTPAAFDPNTAPWMNVTVLWVEDDLYWVDFHYNRILIDGRSMREFRVEVIQTYEALLEGREPDLPQHRPVSAYFDWVQEQDVAQAEAYWKGLRSELKPFKPASVGVQLDASLVIPEDGRDTLIEASQEFGLALSTLFIGCWALDYAHLSGERHLVACVFDSGRPAGLTGADGIIGAFSFRLPVVVRIDDEGESVGAWLRRLQLQLADARTFHYALSDAAMERWWGLPRGHTPGYDIEMNFQREPAEIGYELTRSLPFDHELTRFVTPEDWRVAPTSVSVWFKEDRDVRINRAYDAQVFSVEQADAHLEGLANTLDTVIANPDQSIADVFAQLDDE